MSSPSVLVKRTNYTTLWLTLGFVLIMITRVISLSGPNVCMVKQKYNITKRVKYRAPMAVRSYEWCFSMPPRCSKWTTEMKDLTKLETEERTLEVAVCCPGFKMRDINCIPICPAGRTGIKCSEDCPDNRWGPSCVNVCNCPERRRCIPATGVCCVNGRRGESCEPSMTTIRPLAVDILTTTKSTTNTVIIPLTITTTVAPNNPIISTSTKITPIKKTNENDTILSPKSIITNTTNQTNETANNLSIKKLESDLINNENDNISKSDIKPTTEYKIESITREISNDNITISTPWFIERYRPTTEDTTIVYSSSTTENIQTKSSTDSTTIFHNNPTTEVQTTTTHRLSSETIKTPSSIYYPNSTTIIPETTIRFYPTTLKTKPKEIWIRPAQKGDETKKYYHDTTKYKIASKNDSSEITTPKTIVVSIIPTSSYTTFKRISLSTKLMPQKIFYSISPSKDSFVKSSTNSMTVSTNSPTTISSTIFLQKIKNTLPTLSTSLSSTRPYTLLNRKEYTKIIKTKILSKSNSINSMTSTEKNDFDALNLSNILATSTNPSNKSSTKNNKLTENDNVAMISKSNSSPSVSSIVSTIAIINRTKDIESSTISSPTEGTKIMLNNNRTFFTENTNFNKKNESFIETKTNRMLDDETTDDMESFPILTEPEHITAVMNDKGSDRASADLISVIGIAGGVMMAVITVATVIVMVERCRKPRYEDVRKMNTIRMEVMIDNNDAPPPYVRSIFHTPLPELPTSEKCHYQPISTLDRSLKQFMRPVVVQTVSPLMLENFRGILECHYDHLPRRSQEFGPVPVRYSATPSMCGLPEPLQPQTSLEATLDAMKREANMDVIDNTTSEPLYAEIPCWRPPSEHAVEVINTYGEAVTEL